MAQEFGEVFTDVRTDKNGHYRLYLEPDTYGHQDPSARSRCGSL